MVPPLSSVFESGKKKCELILGSSFLSEKTSIYFVKIFEDKTKLWFLCYKNFLFVKIIILSLYFENYFHLMMKYDLVYKRNIIYPAA